MVETMALIYYNALRQATKSTVLRQICKQILRDEVAHIRFQNERLAHLHKDRSYLLRTLTYMLHYVLFLGIVIAVWIGHHKTLKAGGYDFGRYWRTAWTKMRFSWRQMDPRQYEWEEKAALKRFSDGSAALSEANHLN